MVRTQTLATCSLLALLGASCQGARLQRGGRLNRTAVSADSCDAMGCNVRYDRNRDCQCNKECPQYGNCCADYASQCGADDKCSAIGCGAGYDASLPCQCNSNCPEYSNCCSDYNSLCSGPLPSPSPSPSPWPSPSPSPSPGGGFNPSPSPGGGGGFNPSPSPIGAGPYWSDVDTSSKLALQLRMRRGFQHLSYSRLWDAYKSVWVGLPGKCSTGVYDIYSTKCWVPGSSQCGSYRFEGVCYNREHSWPKSWWDRIKNDAYSDMFHVMPSDGYVNGRRGSHPFGEVNGPTYTSREGNKVGPCSTPGYSGTCFEPVDRVKGLLARGHFYVSVRYDGEFGCCEKDAVSRSEIKPWMANLLMKWHAAHPPEAWEQEFNDRVQGWQGNRNPFIDFPEAAQAIFR